MDDPGEQSEKQSMAGRRWLIAIGITLPLIALTLLVIAEAGQSSVRVVGRHALIVDMPNSEVADAWYAMLHENGWKLWGESGRTYKIDDRLVLLKSTRRAMLPGGGIEIQITSEGDHHIIFIRPHETAPPELEQIGAIFANHLRRRTKPFWQRWWNSMEHWLR